ncbi:hypothetical protein ACP70R_005526 [Stipagrostis hirtigluma subsp. patula]
MAKLFLALCVVLLANAAHVESRRQGLSDEPPKQYKLFVFGDDSADTGNIALADLSRTTRAWYHPYGSNDYQHDTSPTGRFSNGIVQSDFLARILGHDESPPAERLRNKDGIYPFGTNFAAGGAGVLNGTDEVPKLNDQISKFRRLLNHGIIKKDLKDSVALIAFSGSRDYVHVHRKTSQAEIDALAQKVTDKIVDGVNQLQKLGVTKFLVNRMPPFGCAPRQTRSNNYKSCDEYKNNVTETHNMFLLHKLIENEKVLMLNMDTIFNDFVVNNPEIGQSGLNRFRHKLVPCCESFADDGFCGQMKKGKAHYSVCKKPEAHFYWDDVNPTEAGWKLSCRISKSPSRIS